MSSFNKVILLGNLTRDPEIKQFSNGNLVCNMGLAVSKKYKTKDGEQREKVCFIDVKAFNKLGEICNKFLHKGNPVLVEGELEQDTWGEGDSKRSKHLINASNVQFMPSGKGAESASPEAPKVDEDDYNGFDA